MSAEMPVGVDYQVPVGKTLKVTRLLTYRESADSYLEELGYGDDAVPSGGVAPTAAVPLIIGVGETELFEGADDIEVYFEIPAGKYPYAKLEGTAPSPMAILLFGVEG